MISCICAVISLLGSAPVSIQTGNLPATIASAIKTSRIPGVGIGVVVNGRLVFGAGYGVKNLDTQSPVTPATRFEIGSITKQFTAAAILQLKEQGKLKLSDPLGKYVPEYPLGKNITIEQLLWQVSGIPDYINDVPNLEKIALSKPGGLRNGLENIKGRPLYFKPGTQWRYSNTNYLLLGAVVERVSHMPWEAFVRKNIFTRAGMTHSAFIPDEPHLPDMATGYRAGKGRLSPVPAKWLHALSNGWAGSDGAIVSTVGDMARWDNAFFGGKIVNAADVRLATTADILPSGKSTYYGFGWAIGDLDGEKRIWHNGSTLGFGAANEYFPDLHEAIVVLTNNENGASGSDIAFFEALHPSIAGAARKSASGEDPRITAIAREWIHRIQTGHVDRSQLTPYADQNITPDELAMAQETLGSLGDPQLVYLGRSSRNGATTYNYRVIFKAVTLLMNMEVDRNGKVNPALRSQ
jgi:CubicO group peptidase (beta-lactamase class C family)